MERLGGRGEVAGCLNMFHSNIYGEDFWSLQDDDKPSAHASTKRFSLVELARCVQVCTGFKVKKKILSLTFS